MMIKNDIKSLMDARGLSRYRLWKDTGFNRETAYRLYDDPDYIPSKTIMEKLWEIYRWQPAQYIICIPEEMLVKAG
ncbi:XRE family transcriptional regulator [Pleurocapsa sp. CCALA 161]|nr:XRE family transcriptional regulator [Pleurocapsa sp. CCALA 161]